MHCVQEKSTELLVNPYNGNIHNNRTLPTAQRVMSSHIFDLCRKRNLALAYAMLKAYCNDKYS